MRVFNLSIKKTIKDEAGLKRTLLTGDCYYEFVCSNCGEDGTPTWNNTIASCISTHPYIFKSGQRDTGQNGNWTLYELIPPKDANLKKPPKSSYNKDSNNRSPAAKSNLKRNLKEDHKSPKKYLKSKKESHPARKRLKTHSVHNALGLNSSFSDRGYINKVDYTKFYESDTFSESNSTNSDEESLESDNSGNSVNRFINKDKSKNKAYPLKRSSTCSKMSYFPEPIISGLGHPKSENLQVLTSIKGIHDKYVKNQKLKNKILDLIPRNSDQNTCLLKHLSRDREFLFLESENLLSYPDQNQEFNYTSSNKIANIKVKHPSKFSETEALTLSRNFGYGIGFQDILQLF
ncbi:hypothetical protein BB560_005310 [Smittium megazygosporum]|uniref:Uncharacterized protein n=1 Tax=Smittium megazygosporum TaxID=133381 RepID=A0A2T9Z6U9_9FUNG|nr:hypothetical protein BB560_005310 [Smittium megazygosporum]